MATITVTDLSIGAGVGTFVNDLSTYAGGTTHYIAGVEDVKNLHIQACNTNAASKTLTIKAGDFYQGKGIGDLAINLMQNDEVGVQIEGTRHLNADGTIGFTVTAGATGRISCVERK